MQKVVAISIFPQAQNYFFRLHFLGFINHGISGGIPFSGIQLCAEAQ